MMKKKTQRHEKTLRAKILSSKAVKNNSITPQGDRISDFPCKLF